MYNSFPGIRSQAERLVWKFFAMTSFGVWASQSVSWMKCKWYIITEITSSYQKCRVFAECTIVEYLHILVSVDFQGNGKWSFTRRNSAPLGLSAVAWRECGIPGGKYHKSPAPYTTNMTTIQSRNFDVYLPQFQGNSGRQNWLLWLEPCHL